VAYGFVAEVLTVLTIIAIVMAHRYLFARGMSEGDYAAFGVEAGRIVGTAGGTIYTFLLTLLLMPRLAGHSIEHGIVVAATAIVFSTGGSIAGHHGFPAGYPLASALKLVAGALAGFLYSRSRATAQSDTVSDTGLSR
jgi:hypothetical protein